MGTIDVSKLLKSAASSAASSFGSAVGAAAADYVLNLVGIETDELAPIKRALTDIQQTLKRVETRLATIDAKIDWLLTLNSFATLKALVDSQFNDVASLIQTEGNAAKREAEMRSYLSSLDAAALEAAITRLNNDVTGQSAMFGTGVSAAARLYDTEWSLFQNMGLEEASDQAMDICYRLIDLQWRGALLVYNIRVLRGEVTVARNVITRTMQAMHAQHRQFILEAPSLMAYVMSGFPYAAGPGGGWGVTVQAILKDTTETHLTPEPFLWNNRKLIASNMSSTSERITLMTSLTRPLKFEFRQPNTNFVMTFDTQTVEVDAGKVSGSTGIAPKTQNVPLARWNEWKMVGANAASQLIFTTTATRDVYTVKAGTQMLTVFHRKGPDRNALTAASGVVEFDYNITHAISTGTPVGFLSEWTIKVVDSNKRIYDQMY